MPTSDEVAPLVCAILENVKTANNTKTEAELAQLLGVSTETLRLWRDGLKLGKSGRILLPLAARYRPTTTPFQRIRRRRGRPVREVA